MTTKCSGFALSGKPIGCVDEKSWSVARALEGRFCLLDEQNVALQWLTGGSANAITSALLNPLDVVKTQLQTKRCTSGSSSSSSSSSGNRRMISTMISLSQRKGIFCGLFLPGLRESMAREMLNSGARAGFYVPIRNFVQNVCNKKSIGEESRSSSSTFVTKAATVFSN